MSVIPPATVEVVSVDPTLTEEISDKSDPTALPRTIAPKAARNHVKAGGSDSGTSAMAARPTTVASSAQSSGVATENLAMAATRTRTTMTAPMASASWLGCDRPSGDPRPRISATRTPKPAEAPCPPPPRLSSALTTSRKNALGEASTKMMHGTPMPITTPAMTRPTAARPTNAAQTRMTTTGMIGHGLMATAKPMRTPARMSRPPLAI